MSAQAEDASRKSRKRNEFFMVYAKNVGLSLAVGRPDLFFFSIQI
jgi:hypothetical protein